jgi:uncharacterized Zn-finger protein
MANSMKSSKVLDCLGIGVGVLKPYGCDICKKRFSETKLLKYHKNTHRVERLYECDACDKKFKASGNVMAKQPQLK